jgi:anti-sigma factor RsiW
MNAPLNYEACEQYEHEIADLVDGLLPETDLHRVRAHLANCAGCRAWQAQYADVNERLGAVLPKPGLSSGFDTALQARLQALKSANGRDVRRAAADAEHDALLLNLRKYTRRNAVLGALGGALAAGCAIVALQRLVQEESAVQAALQGSERLVVFGAIGAIIAVGVIGWTLSRGAMVTPRFVRW